MVREDPLLQHRLAEQVRPAVGEPHANLRHGGGGRWPAPGPVAGALGRRSWRRTGRSRKRGAGARADHSTGVRMADTGAMPIRLPKKLTTGRRSRAQRRPTADFGRRGLTRCGRDREDCLGRCSRWAEVEVGVTSSCASRFSSFLAALATPSVGTHALKHPAIGLRCPLRMQQKTRSSLSIARE